MASSDSDLYRAGVRVRPSSLAGVCRIAAGAPKNTIHQYGNLCYIENIVRRFEGTGLVSAYSTYDFAKSAAKWQFGDMLVSDLHVTVVVSEASPGGGSVTAAVGSINERARAVIAGRFGSGDARQAALGD